MLSNTSCSNSCSQTANSIPKKKTDKETADFFVEQIFTGCLAEYSYYIDSEGEALIIDPIYDHKAYTNLALERGAKIKYIFETHFHADFVSGHVDLAKETGAQIIFGPKSKANFEFHLAKDCEVFKLGKAQFEILHTPGHTPESSCLVLKDSNGKPHSVYTGDTLFLNEVGRPDLAANEELKPEDMASMLFDSIRRLMELPDEVIVFPGHGAGSPCGKSIGQGDYSTIGEQKKSNYAMALDLKREDFIKIASANLPRPLGYMGHDVSLNKGGKNLKSAEELVKSCKKSFEEFRNMTAKDPKIVVLDTRDDLSKGFLQGALTIGLNSTFSITVGTLIKSDAPIFLITQNNEKAEEAIIRLLRVGYDNIAGYLDGGEETWLKNNGGVYQMQNMQPEKFKEVFKPKETHVIDVRNKHEWHDTGILEGARLVPLRDIENEILNGTLDELRKETFYVHCKTGPRALIAYTLFRKYGFDHVTIIAGGLSKLMEANMSLEKPLLD